MKAIRKSDGKVIEVEPQRFMEQDGSMYAPSELDFNVEEAEQTESAVTSGWVARDEDGFISLFNDKRQGTIATRTIFLTDFGMKPTDIILNFR